MEFTGEYLLGLLDNQLAEQFHLSELTPKEQAIFFLGMSIAAESVEYLIRNNIPLQGAPTSYKCKQQCLQLCTDKLTLNEDYYLRKLKKLAQDN